MVEAVGPAVTDLAPGRRVGVGALCGSCMHCEWCIGGRQHVCPQVRGTVMGEHKGGFASVVRVNQSLFAHPIPDKIASEHADRQQFREAILAKYGPPYREVKAISALWCNKGTSFGSGPLACAPDVPSLQLKGNELILSDSGPYHRERAAWNAKTTGAPPL